VLAIKPTETIVFHDPATGYYGYKIRFLDRESFHRTFDTCLTLQDALDNCDPQREQIWEEPSDADESKLLISRAVKKGSVLWRMEHGDACSLDVDTSHT
jgi:hypothetical protein